MPGAIEVNPIKNIWICEDLGKPAEVSVYVGGLKNVRQVGIAVMT